MTTPDPSLSDRLAAAEAEVARLHRQSAHLTEEVHDLLARLQEAHTDADRLAVAVLVASGDMDAAEALGPHPTAAEVDAAVNNAAARILNEWGPWRPAGGAR